MPRTPNYSGMSTQELFGSLRADYNIAKRGRFRRKRKGVSTSGRTADWHYRAEGDYLYAMETARDCYRNDTVVGQGVRRAVDNVIQDGIRFDPQTGNEKLNVYLLAKWNRWASDKNQCDISGRLDFHGMEWLVLLQTIVDGDVFALLPDTPQVQLIEGHRCRTPSNTKMPVVHGVRLDEWRKPVEYWFTKDDLSPNRQLARVSDCVKYGATNEDGTPAVLHVYRPDRVSQTRGITAFAPAIDSMGMGDDLFFAQLVKAQVASCYAIFREYDGSAVFAGGSNPDERGAESTDTWSDGTSRNLEGIAPGMEIFGRPGEKLQGFSPNVPNQEFFSHAMLILTFVAINLDLPLAVLLLDPSKTNFSGWRGAIDQARITFRRIQRWMTGCFHRPVYEWKLRQWLDPESSEFDETLARLVASAGEADLFAHRWNPPTWAYIEPLKDASGDLIRVRNALISPRRLHAERGRDWDEIAREIVEDNAAAIRMARQTAGKLNQEFEGDGQDVHWRELISLPTPDGVNISLATDNADATGPQDGGKQDGETS